MAPAVPVVPPIFHPRTILVGMETVRALRGVEAEDVLHQVEAGRLRYVFNVCAGKKHISELRFLLRELMGAVPPSADACIGEILGPHRVAWRGIELSQLLLVSRATIHHLHHSNALPGKVTGNTLWVQRAALEAFLRSRLIGTAN